MSNIVTQYIRRIGKYLSEVGDKPLIAPEGTNHIDDAVLWGDKTIYKGETVVNLATGKSYTSDNKQIIEISAANAIVYGMQVVSVPAAINDANSLWLKVSDGYIKVNGRLLKHKSVATTAQSNGDILITENNAFTPRYDLVYAYNDPTNTALVEGEHKAMLTVIAGSTNIQDLYNQSYIDALLAAHNPILTQDTSVFLGFVYVPANYTAASQNLLRPWSSGVSSEGNGENLLNFNHAQSINTQAVSPGALLSEVLSTVATHFDANGDLRKRYTYIAGQLLVFDNEQPTPDKKIYKVISTHFCESLSISLANNLIAVLGGGSGGGTGTDDHSYLLNLGYDDSGHYGFQRKTIAATRNPDAGDCITPDAQHQKASVGTLWINTISKDIWICVNDNVNAAVWVNSFGSVRDVETDKNLQCNVTVNDSSLIINQGLSYQPAPNTYVKVEINGVGVTVGNGSTTGCDCYFSNDGGVTAKTVNTIEMLDMVYWNGSVAGYELTSNDYISIFYLVSSLNIGTMSEPLWGGYANGDLNVNFPIEETLLSGGGAQL